MMLAVMPPFTLAVGVIVFTIAVSLRELVRLLLRDLVHLAVESLGLDKFVDLGSREGDEPRPLF